MHHIEAVVLARHGQTEWNVAGRRQAQLDSPLTDSGREQAAALAEFITALPPDRLFTSPLGRELTTARVCAELTGLAVETSPLLAEVHHGVMAGLTTAEIERQFPGQLAQTLSQQVPLEVSRR